jgi:hypothetical protein
MVSKPCQDRFLHPIQVHTIIEKNENTGSQMGHTKKIFKKTCYQLVKCGKIWTIVLYFDKNLFIVKHQTLKLHLFLIETKQWTNYVLRAIKTSPIFFKSILNALKKKCFVLEIENILSVFRSIFLQGAVDKLRYGQKEEGQEIFDNCSYCTMPNLYRGVKIVKY